MRPTGQHRQLAVTPAINNQPGPTISQTLQGSLLSRYNQRVAMRLDFTFFDIIRDADMMKSLREQQMQVN